MRKLSLLIAFALFLSLAQMAKAQAGEVSLKLPDGLTVWGTLSLAEGKSLDKDGVVMIVHGTLAHKDMAIVTAQRDLLTEGGFNVLAINLSLGVDKREGMYDCAVAHRHKHLDAITEIGAWMEWLKGQGASAVYLMGHSRGGNQVARYVVESQNELVKKLILVAPQTWSEASHVASYEKRYKKDYRPILNEMMAKQKAGSGAEMIKDVDFVYCAKATASADAFVSYYEHDPRMNTPSLLKSIKIPTLVVAGSKDTVVEDLPAQMEGVEQDNVSFVTIEDADHMFIDFAGEDLADQIGNFLGNE